MKTFIFTTVGFAGGFGLGYLICNKIVKKKYQKIADAEVASVKQSLEAYYNANYIKKDITPNTKSVVSKKAEENKKITTKPVIGVDSIDYEKLKQDKEKYIDYANIYKAQASENKKEETPTGALKSKPYVITPDDFANSDFDFRTLNYYSDGVLADDDYNVIKDINGLIGSDSLNSFGLYEADVIYVRNEEHQIDYEVLLDERAYHEVAPRGTTRSFPGDDE